MKIERIFANSINKELWGACYKPAGSRRFVSVYEKLFFGLWQDTEYLTKFFLENEALLQDPYWAMSVADAVIKVQDEAADFVEQLYLIENKKPGYEESVSEIFDQLHKNGFEYRGLNFNMYKARPKVIGNKPILRIYALKLDDSFIITGGIIKLVKRLPNYKEPLLPELQKLQTLAEYISQNQIQTCSDF